MPEYNITSPTGEKFRINAPDGATKQQVMQYAQMQFTQQPAQLPMQEQPTEDVTLGQRAGNAWEGIKRGATLGFGDEIQAGIAGAVGALSPDLTFKQGYDQALADFRGEYEQAREQTPWTTGAGELAGAIGTGITATPRVVSGALTNVASKGFLPRAVTAAGVGGASGGVYGFGTSENGANERAKEAAIMAGLGTLTGGGGSAIGSGLGRLGKKVAGLIDKKRGASLPATTTPSVPAITGADKQALSKLSQSPDEVFAKSMGQKTQLPKAQRLEADALAGLFGDDAERAVRQGLIAQSRQRKDFLQNLGDIDKAGNANDVLDNVFDSIKNQSTRLKGDVNDAYALAREGGGTKIDISDINDGLVANIGKLRQEGAYDLSLMPQALARVDDLKKIVSAPAGGKITNAKLNALENFRTRVTRGITSSQDGSEKSFLRGVLDEYDDFMYRTANEAVDSADDNAIMAFRDAVRKRREYGKLYESDKFVEDLVKGKMGVDDAVKNLIGTGSIVGKKRMESTYDAILKAAGDEAEAVQADLQTAFAKKLLQQSTEGLEAGGEQAYLSAAKMQTALRGLFENNMKFAQKLYGDDAVNIARRAIDELEPIARTQASTGNPSGSGQIVLRHFMKLPVFNFIAKGFEMAGDSMKAGAVKKSFGDLVRELPTATQSELFSLKGAIGGGVAPSIVKKEDE